MEVLSATTGIVAAVALIWTLQEPIVQNITSRCPKYYSLRFILAALSASCAYTAFVPATIPAILLTSLIAIGSI